MIFSKSSEKSYYTILSGFSKHKYKQWKSSQGAKEFISNEQKGDIKQD